jgi:Flp pilus assembly protein TadD
MRDSITARGPAQRRALAAVAFLALALGGCLSKGPETTGSLAAGEAAARTDVQAWSARYAAKPDDRDAALGYARALRATDQKAQAAAVLQQAALRNAGDAELLAAYGKSLAETGRLVEAAQVLANAHAPDRPDWRILSAQGAVADQMGDPAKAQRYYEAALKIVPGEPAVLSNLGLSYALSRRLPEAEQTLRQAAANPRADARVRQNLALVLGLRGQFDEAEAVLRRDVSPDAAAETVASMRRTVAAPARKVAPARG